MKGLWRSLALLLLPVVALAQTLAHPGWRGNGISSELWWKHAVLVRLPPDSTFAAAANVMDAMSEAGADSMILPDLRPAGETALAAEPFLARFGTEEELDALLREAAARRMHVLVRADVVSLAASSGEVRFWMSRGIAGFDVGDVTPAQMDSLQLLRGSMDRFPGRRILLAHTPPVARGNSDPVTLHLQPGSGTGAVEIKSLEALRSPLPPGSTLIVDAALLTDAATRDSIRRAAAAQSKAARTYSGTRSRRRRSR